MNGPEHYAEAERLLAEAVDRTGAVMSHEDEANQIAEAQVHATLALAAATLADRMISPQQQWGGHAIEVNHNDWGIVR